MNNATREYTGNVKFGTFMPLPRSLSEHLERPPVVRSTRDACAKRIARERYDRMYDKFARVSNFVFFIERRLSHSAMAARNERKAGHVSGRAQKRRQISSFGDA